MTARTISLAIFELRRLARHRALAAVLIALPFVAAIARILFDDAGFSLALVHLCPCFCALLSAAVVAATRALDRATGLAEVISSCPLSGKSIFVSSLIAWGVIYLLQMAVLTGILALR